MTGTLLHATAIVRDESATLLMGTPGAGKSDLALRMIDRGWTLLADDYVEIARHGERIRATPPARTRGLLEVRGLGILSFPHVGPTSVILAVELGIERDRLPVPEVRLLLDVAVPLIRLDPRPASAPIKLDLAFAQALERL